MRSSPATGVGHGAEPAPSSGRRGFPEDGIAVAAARRAGLLTWFCALGAMGTFAPDLPAAVMPGSVAWLAGLAAHWQWVYAGLALVGAALALGLSSGHRRHVLVPLGMVAAA